MKKTAGVGGRTDYAAIFNRNFNVVALINLFTMISYYLIFVISTPYAISRFHTTPNVAGLTAASSSSAVWRGVSSPATSSLFSAAARCFSAALSCI